MAVILQRNLVRFQLLLLCLLPPFCLLSQGEFNQWRFGFYAGLDFNFTPPVAVSGSPMQSYPSPINVSDSLGNILFYSNGSQVWNRNNQPMPNGSGLFGYIINSQAVFTIQNLSDHNKYFLFTLGHYGFIPQGLYYSVIDMTLNGGLGDVVNGMKNIPVYGGENTANWMSGTRHKNNKDAWLIVRSIVPSQYLAYKITSSGIDTIPIVSPSIVNTTIVWPENYGGTLKISQDGNKIITN